MADDKVQEYDSYPSDHAYKQQVMNDEQTGPRDDGPGAQPGRSYVGEGNDISAYVGVDKEYQNYANETEKPYRSESGPEAYFEAMARGELKSEDEEDDSKDDGEDDKKSSEPVKSAGPAIPPKSSPIIPQNAKK